MDSIGLMVRSVAMLGIANVHVPVMRRVSNHRKSAIADLRTQYCRSRVNPRSEAAPILRDAPKAPMSGKPDIGGRSSG